MTVSGRLPKNGDRRKRHLRRKMDFSPAEKRKGIMEAADPMEREEAARTGQKSEPQRSCLGWWQESLSREFSMDFQKRVSEPAAHSWQRPKRPAVLLLIPVMEFLRLRKTLCRRSFLSPVFLKILLRDGSDSSRAVRRKELDPGSSLENKMENSSLLPITM